MEIRTRIYTTNAIESVNSRILKFANGKYQFPDDDAALKAVFFALSGLEQTWSHSIPNWGIILNQFLIIFGDRCGM